MTRSTDTRQTPAELAGPERARQDHERAMAAAAHDLQEPLRAISSFCELLREHLGEGLDARAAGYLEQAQASAARGRELVRDVLELAAAGRVAEPVEPVELELALAEALGNLAGALIESDGQLEVGPLPAVLARRGEVVRVLQNVLANALAYRRGPGPRIRVRARVDGAEVELRVQDDGVGIDPADAERIFEAFTRLSPELHEGTGLGLTLCRRLMRSHGGSIELRPGDDGGALCVLRWPVSEPFADLDQASPSGSPEGVGSPPDVGPAPGSPAGRPNLR